MTDRDRILQKTNGGFDVFTHYMGEDCKKKVFRNPFRTDNSPSCHLYFHEDQQGGEGRFILKDFGDSEWRGDCFWLVGRICNLDVRNDFMEILRTIDKELNLFILDDASVNSHPVMKKVERERVSDNRPVKFAPKYRNFNKHEIAYWAAYGITLSVLERFHVRSLSSCYFERADGTNYNIYGTLEAPMFGYTFFEGAGIKVYRPHVQIGRFMYAGTLPKPYVFGWEQLSSHQNYVIVTGGEKDVMSLSAHGFDAICLNSETAKLPFSLLEQLTGRYEKMVFLYDCDETGRRESALRVKEWNEFMDGKNCGHLLKAYSVTLPLAGTKQDKDASDFFKSGSSAVLLRDILLTTFQSENQTKI